MHSRIAPTPFRYCRCIHAWLQAGELLGHPVVFLQQVVALVLLAALIVWAMFKKGQLLVDRPQLRPDLAHPWS